MKINQKYLETILSYNPLTGDFTWLITKSSTGQKNTVAGVRNTIGYHVIRIDKKLYLGHRLAWLYMYGYLPKRIDHINQVRFDNRIANLRKCEHWQNITNAPLRKTNTHGYRGVYWHRPTQSWQAQIQVNNHQQHLGLFKYKEEAAIAYNKAALAQRGEFAILNQVPAA